MYRLRKNQEIRKSRKPFVKPVPGFWFTHFAQQLLSVFPS